MPQIIKLRGHTWSLLGLDFFDFCLIFVSRDFEFGGK